MTKLCQSKVDADVFAAGYEDGKIRIWDSRTATIVVALAGHRSAVTDLEFDDSGVRLASGSKDADIIVWDLVAEVGLFRLKGHKDQITSLTFLRKHFHLDPTDTNGTSNGADDSLGFLISTGKDALIKLWDLSLQHCTETHVAQNNGECWALGMSPDQTGCITAGNDGELRVWSINTTNALSASTEESEKVLKFRGSFYRHGKDRTTGVSFHPHQDLIAIHGSEKAVELWRIRPESEIRKTLARKKKRKNETGDGLETKDGTTKPESEASDTTIPPVTDLFVLYVIVRTGGKVRSVDWAQGKTGKLVSFMLGTTNNQIEVYNVVHTGRRPEKERPPNYDRPFSVDMPGHRTDIRCLALSSDDRMLASASHGTLRIWNMRTQSCIRSLDCGYALCATFLPGDKIVVVGTRDGTLEVFDISSSMLLEAVNAHDRDIWSLHVQPDGKSLVTGSADRSTKIWEFRVNQVEVLGTTRKIAKLTLVHTRTLKLSDDVLAVRYSPDAKLLAVSTLDSTVKVFFTDTLKLFLTLYGHKLPVLSMDISYDSKLIVTSSADKNVRLWGLDFGDCHKAFFAHQDSIMSVAFLPPGNEGNGHNFFSASKDQTIKYYDGDKFEQIQRLDGHHGEIWAMVVAHSGEFFVSASHDKSIRMWQQTDEPIFLEEEREKELEALYENSLLTALEQDEREAQGNGEVAAAGKQTVETLMAGEKIVEALELGVADLEMMKECQRVKTANPKAAIPSRNPVFLANNNISASEYVLKVFQRIPSASLQDALLVLSFSQLPSLLIFLALWASEGRNLSLTCRILLFMLGSHQRQLVSSRLMRSHLENVQCNLRESLREQKTEIEFNLVGLRSGRRYIDELN